jgi:hypothetical protein
VKTDYAVLAELSKGLSGGDILNICLNAIYMGSTDPNPERSGGHTGNDRGGDNQGQEGEGGALGREGGAKAEDWVLCLIERSLHTRRNSILPVVVSVLVRAFERRQQVVAAALQAVAFGIHRLAQHAAEGHLALLRQVKQLEAAVRPPSLGSPWPSTCAGSPGWSPVPSTSRLLLRSSATRLGRFTSDGLPVGS